MVDATFKNKTCCVSIDEMLVVIAFLGNISLTLWFSRRKI